MLLSIVNLVSIILMTVGAWTRISMIVAFITLISFRHRNGYILNSVDSVVGLISFLMTFTPYGDAFSIDRWRFTRKA